MKPVTLLYLYCTLQVPCGGQQASPLLGRYCTCSISDFVFFVRELYSSVRIQQYKKPRTQQITKQPKSTLWDCCTCRLSAKVAFRCIQQGWVLQDGTSETVDQESIHSPTNQEDGIDLPATMTTITTEVDLHPRMRQEGANEAIIP
jgi:hypothetical protein